ncbi:nodulation protein NfeD [Salinicola corii]|uniref:Nodulation protein NfeD n=1 Tax=Salinicola corii TaxID=2606937 RepID=A0A640W961_9GAMM|nr:nodulation protein NfeD [Salinicola corii]KAA0016437.1 nodulation protein NfeD [Salinicola corii]
MAHSTGGIRKFPTRRQRCVGWLACLLVGGLVAMAALAQSSSAPQALVLTLDDGINPATRDYVERGIRQAESMGAELLVVELDTPGGQVESMRRLAQSILAAEVPVAIYVTPSGARAASAGTYLLYASPIAAMAPGTHLGSATPVTLGGDIRDDADGEAMRRKVVEDAVATIRGYALRHGRNADWAEQAVREAANLGAQEALDRNVIDLVATDLDDLLAQLDGRPVTLETGTRTLSTESIEIVREMPDWRTSLLSFIANPTIAYGLLLIGFYGLVFELASPGTIIPGVVGGISLLLGLFAFQVLSIDLAGLGLVVLGLAMIVGEAFLPSFGALGVGGIVAFVIGSILLMDEANSAVAWPLIGGTALVAAGFLLWGVIRLMGVRRRIPLTGREELIGADAVALGDFSAGRGKVLLHGERWRARGEARIHKGDKLRVTALDGLTVSVEPIGVACPPAST